MSQDSAISPDNNFDLLRLLAAFQVLFFHASAHLRVPDNQLPAFTDLFQYFEGVPIFFVISGFLISLSYERNRTLKLYIQNRALRIYPALWVCLAGSILILVLFGYAGFFTDRHFVPWLIGQITIVQFFNPDYLRSFGVGVINGSLWTIPVELEFYILIPFIYFAVLNRVKIAAGNYLLLSLMLCSFSAFFFINRIGYADNFWLKFSMVTIGPHLYMFLFGVLFQRNYRRVSKLTNEKIVFWSVVYIGYRLLVEHGFHMNHLDSFLLLLLSKFLLAVWVIAFAFSFRNLSEKCLRGNDISYGVYIYHMLVVNTLVQLGLRDNAGYLLITVVGTAMIGFLSWKYIERPALKLKKASLRPL